MNLEDLGCHDLEQAAQAERDGFRLGRVVAEHRSGYVVSTEQGELDAELTGNLRYSASRSEDLPAVGDWVSLVVCDASFALIHGVLPRRSVLARQAVDRFGATQIIAANVDCAFLVQALDRDFNLNRLERYLTICHAAGVRPVVVLTKADLASPLEIAERIAALAARIGEVPVVAISNVAPAGYDGLKPWLEKGKTYCLLGSSGVGKSTLVNGLAGAERMRTDSISASTHKGRHVTSHRELVVLANGALLIDTPGMREVGIVDGAQGLETTFDAISDLAAACRFKDCRHVAEAGCAVLAAVERGDLAQAAHASYLRMERERAHFEASADQRRKKDKAFGKMLKNYSKGR